MQTITEYIKAVIRHYIDIFPPGILILDNLANVFWMAGFANEFQSFAASPVRRKVWDPSLVNAAQPMW